MKKSFYVATMIAALLAITFILAVLSGVRAQERPPPLDQMSASERTCADEYIADDHPTDNEMAAYHRCVAAKSVIYRWRPWQQVWQCNDIRMTVTSRQQGLIEYDLGGSIWGGSQFTVDLRRGGGKEAYWFNGRPCIFLGGTR
jgi:hypothetical protein